MDLSFLCYMWVKLQHAPWEHVKGRNMLLSLHQRSGEMHSSAAAALASEGEWDSICHGPELWFRKQFHS